MGLQYWRSYFRDTAPWAGDSEEVQKFMANACYAESKHKHNLAMKFLDKAIVAS